jgi:hypothetical protein
MHEKRRVGRVLHSERATRVVVASKSNYTSKINTILQNTIKFPSVLLLFGWPKMDIS